MDDGLKEIKVKQTDKAGNTSAEAELSFTLDTFAITPSLTLNKTSVNGTAATPTTPAVPALTNDGTVTVTGLEAGATWQYKIGTDQWKDGSGTSFVVPGKKSGTPGVDDGLKEIKVKQTDKAGNTSAEAELSFTLDTVAPVAPTVTLEKDTGSSGADKNTSNGNVKVEGIEAGASWQWSADNGATWSSSRSDSSATISLSGDGEKAFKVRVSDRVGNVTETSALNFTLDTVVNYPTFSLTGSARQNGAFTYSGSDAEKNATIALKSGKLTLGTTTASDSGAWSMEIHGTLRVSGLRQVDGRDSNANGVYTIVPLSEAARLGNTNTFSSDFSLTGTPILDTNQELYSMTKGGVTWYVWAPVNGGYIISRASGADEWYQSPFATNGTKTVYARDVTVWSANSANAVTLQAQQLLNNGESSNSRRLADVETLGAFMSTLSNLPSPFTFYAQQTDVAGNTTIDAGAPTRDGESSLTRTFLAFDLDDSEAGYQTTLLRQTTPAELLGGTAFAPNADSHVSTVQQISTIRTIRLEFGGGGLSLDNDKLLLDVERSLNLDFEETNKSIGGVTGLTLKYVSGSRTLEINNSGNPIKYVDLNPIIRDIRLKNTSGTPGERTMTVTMLDSFGVPSPRATATLSVINGGLLLDLDPATAGTQFSATLYITSAASLVAGVTFANQIVAPTAANIRGLEVKLSGAGLDVANDKLGLDVALNLNASLGFVTGKTVGGVAGLSYSYDGPNRNLTVVKTNGSALTGSEVEAIVESLTLSNAAAGDGERIAELRLIQAGADGLRGPYSTARLILDTTAPVLDLDANTSGLQTATTKITTLTSLQTGSGVGLFDKTIAIAPATDIRQIMLEYTGLEAEKVRDGLRVEGSPALIPLNGNNNGTFTVGGIATLSYSVTSLADPRPAASRKEVVLSKTSGEAITSAEAKTILEALRMKSTSTTTVDRLLKITLTDMAGNDSTQVSSTVRVDTRELPTLSVAKVDAGNQISYGLLTLDKDLGRDSFKRNLTAGEEVNLPLPAGLTPSSFLTALKAISSDWGGRSISGSSDIIEDRYRSYLTFTSPPVSGRRIPVGHQAHKDIKGDQVTFDISGGVLSLANRGGFVTSDTDMYRFTSNPNNGNGGYDMGNIRLLYQTTTTNTNSTPTIAVTFDRGRAAVGDTIGLYEGDKLLVSKTLVSTDIAGTAARITLNLTVTDSLAKGDHAIMAKFTTPAGATAQSAAETFAIGLDTKAPVLSNLKVKASYDLDANAKALLVGGDRYTSVTDPGLSTGFYDKGLIFSGSVNTPGVTGKQKYLVTLNMGGRMLGFDTFELSTTEDARTSSFTLQAAPNLLAPGLYRDLTVTVTNITEGSIHNGQTSTIKDVSLGWYWAPQYMGNLTGGNGNDGMLLSPPEPLTVPQVTTGAGADTLTVGGFGRSGAKDAAGNWINFSATVTDFQLGLDKVQVWKQNITADNYRSFVSSVGATADGRGTALVVDLDGAGAQRQTYTLTLQNVRYDAANTHTIFGV
nr:hypothetical protein [Herbaspirillum sp. ASV7]